MRIRIETPIIKGMIGFVLLLTMFIFFSGRVHAEGSADLVENGGYRPYTEWTNKTTSGLLRHQIIKAFVKEGETVYFGSSVTKSELAGGDIAIKDPNGNTTTYTNTQSKGYIETPAQESTGPAALAEEGGYPAHSFTATTTGVYVFEFHSTKNEVANPTKAQYNAAWTENGMSVAAWDITVTNNNNPISGRVYTDYLCLNMGANNIPLKSQVYVVTYDGYIYQTDFNGMEPYGFLFFGNNRGLFNTKTQQTAYASAFAEDISKAEMGELEGNMGYYSPAKENDASNRTFKVFFNDPSKDLPTTVLPTLESTATVQKGSLRFMYGDQEGVGRVGKGGDFLFTMNREGESSNAGSYQIEINFGDNNTVVLSGDAQIGENRVHWDGKDANGDPPNKETNYTATLITKGGEYHFLMFDVENNPNGIKNKLTNGNNAGKEWDVYYNNVPLASSQNKKLGDGESQWRFTAANSEEGASAYKDARGNNAAIDYWTFSESSRETADFILEDSLDQNGYITGFVFEDENSDGIYNPSDNDGYIAGASISITSERGEVVDTQVTGNDGTYTSKLLPYGTYTVTVTPPEGKPYRITTGNAGQSGVLGDGTLTNSDSVRMDDVGYDLPRGAFSFTKVDGDTQLPLAGAIFTLSYTDSDGTEKEIDTQVSDDSGQVTFADIKWRADGYTLLEKYAPVGYKPSTDKWNVTIDHDGTVTLSTMDGNRVTTIANQSEILAKKTADLLNWDDRTYTLNLYASCPANRDSENKDTLAAQKIVDTIDHRFVVVDAQGNPLADGATVADGTLHITDDSTYVEWTNQELPQANDPTLGGWTRSIKIKAKADFIGGNAITTNTVEAYVQTAIGTVKFPVPSVNVKAEPRFDNLEETRFWGDPDTFSNEALIDILLKNQYKDYDGELSADRLTAYWSADIEGVSSSDPTAIITEINQATQLKADENTIVQYLRMTYSAGNPTQASTEATHEKVAGDANAGYCVNAKNSGRTIIGNTTKQDDTVLKDKPYGLYTLHIVTGQIQINKTIDTQYSNISKINANQTFVYKIERYEKASDHTPTDTFYETISFDANNGSVKADSRLISGLKKGYYKVTEEIDWAAKYGLESHTTKMGDKETAFDGRAFGSSILSKEKNEIGRGFAIGEVIQGDANTGLKTFSGLEDAKYKNPGDTPKKCMDSEKYNTVAYGTRTQVSFVNKNKNWNWISDTASAINVFNK
ncbi:SpaA isopeptide-forming pilin-related protein [Eubacterium sp.]|uniref:SpaA isopeptide-forming pilin-related protein n=1 Tax=Eubacterium sp. TaxID=142586 RepID=UPI002FC9AC54